MAGAAFGVGGRGWIRADRLLLALTAVAALFAMHGMSSDHMPLTPMHDTSMSQMARMPSQATPAAHERHSGETAISAGAAKHVMSHGECVATLPHATSAPAPMAALTTSAADAGRTAPSLLLTARAPPAPDLDRLCVSRT